jgi:hypothetical protein
LPLPLIAQGGGDDFTCIFGRSQSKEKGMKLPYTTAAALALMVACGSGCSVVMEATRPDPVDTSQFAVGESHLQVVEVLGAPTATVKQGDQSCDIYKLYTHGPSGAGKGAIAAGEAVADVFTLGLAEVVTSPVEGATRNAKHTVTMCYDKDSKLISQNESE